jgi:selenocysteine lyase/cysteine desulfurase
METTATGRYIEAAFESFLKDYPEYRTTQVLDELRDREFARLDREGHVYLDYTGGGLYGEAQLQRHSELLRKQTLGNPHSANPTSRAATELIEQARGRVLEFFNASPDEYAMIFTANATHALKLVGEAYPFERGDRFLLTFDNHNSVNGIREFDRMHGAETIYVPMEPPDLRVDEAVLDRHLELGRGAGNNLFAYPAQANFSGLQHPREWIERAQARGWDVLLDAAAFVPTNRLDLGRWKPDYVALSFYKMFGYPTGIGALIARPPALEKLHRPWFAGGTITVASVQADTYYLAAGSAGFEDGTLDYANIPAVSYGLDFLEEAGIDHIHCRVGCLTGWLVDELLALRHGTGQPLIRLYGPRGTDWRGGAVTMNFYGPAGEVIDHDVIEERASRQRISLRTGCFCNPGAGEMALGLSKAELENCLLREEEQVRMSLDDFRRCVDDKSTGAVRISVGMVSNFADVWAFVDFARGLLVE